MALIAQARQRSAHRRRHRRDYPSPTAGVGRLLQLCDGVSLRWPSCRSLRQDSSRAFRRVHSLSGVPRSSRTSLRAGFRRSRAATERKAFRLNGHRYGVFICYEAVFADEVRHFAQFGAEVLVNISDDGWYGDTSAPWQHLNMARMRAIENRRWILRDTNNGVTAVIDPLWPRPPEHSSPPG